MQWPSYPHIAYNNTYGIQAVNASVYKGMLDAYARPGGCRDQIDGCQAVASVYDPENLGVNATVNRLCAEAETFCSENLRAPFHEVSGRNYYDLTQIDPTPFPYDFFVGWLNQPVRPLFDFCYLCRKTFRIMSCLFTSIHTYSVVTMIKTQHVQAALGIPLNFTSSSSAVSAAFRSIGDYPRPGWLQDLAYLLERGIKVTLVYGDRDYACNWIGGEAASLAIDYAYTSGFHAAGYEPITVDVVVESSSSDGDGSRSGGSGDGRDVKNTTTTKYVGGLVRQFGNLSYSRVFQAGHEVPSWQPETALAIFERALGNRDIATGTKALLHGNFTTTNTTTTSSPAIGGEGENEQYSSVGPSDTWAFKSEIPEAEVWFCYTLVPGTCTEDQLAAVKNGSARISRYIVEDANSTKLFPDLFDEKNEDDGKEEDAQASSTLEPDGGEQVHIDSIQGGLLQLVLGDDDYSI